MAPPKVTLVPQANFGCSHYRRVRPIASEHYRVGCMLDQTQVEESRKRL